MKLVVSAAARVTGEVDMIQSGVQKKKKKKSGAQEMFGTYPRLFPLSLPISSHGYY